MHDDKDDDRDRVKTPAWRRYLRMIRPDPRADLDG